MSERYCPQADISEWGTAVGITRDELPSQVAKKTEEDLEVLSAWVEGDEEELAKELVDSIIVAIGMLGLLGVDFYQAVQDKMTVTWEKYDPDKVEAYMALGMTRDEAFSQLKQEWAVLHPPAMVE